MTYEGLAWTWTVDTQSVWLSQLQHCGSRFGTVGGGELGHLYLLYHVGEGPSLVSLEDALR